MLKFVSALLAMSFAIPAFAADSTLPNLTTGTTPPKYNYGTDGSDVSKKYNGLRVKNVMDYGAVCNGVTNDTVAIQAAVNDTTSPFTTANRGLIWFPSPTACLLGSSVTFELSAGITAIGFAGVPGAKLLGNFADALLKRSVDSPTSGTYFIRDLQFENVHAAGKGIMFHSIVGGEISSVYVSAFIGIETYNSQSVVVSNSTLSPGGLGGSSIGIVAGNATTALAVDASGYDNAIRHQNVGLTVIGGRYESNTKAIVLGVDQSGSTLGTSGCLLSGLSMEANQTGIYSQASAGCQITGVSIAGGISMVAGLDIQSAQDMKITGVVIGGSSFSSGGVVINNATRISLENVVSASATAWSLPSDKIGLTCLNTNAPACAEIPFTVFASLPACNATTDGEAFLLSNANTGTFAATVTTTGAFRSKVRCVNGTGYVVSG